MIGKTISHYKIIEKIGSGGMGIVFKAEDTKLKRTVALKFLPPELLRDNAAKERFTQEAQAASALDHPNICSIFEIDETEDDQMFIAMGYYEGKTLNDKITYGQLEVDEAIDITVQIANGLSRAHEVGIIHRDIKPANIIITNRGEVKILDFGLAKLSGQTRLTKAGGTLGTVAYMSPEQTRGEEVDHKTDIWSLGVVLYEMLTGQLPFKGDYEQAIIYSILNEEPEPLPDVPSEFENIVKKAIAKNPDERYQHINEILVDLKKIKKDKEPQVKTVGYPEKKKTKNWIRKVSIPPATVLILILVFIFLKSFLSDSILISSPKPIAVLPFKNLTGDPQHDVLRETIPSLFITKLQQTQYLQVTDWERMRDILKRIEKGNIEIIDIDMDTGFEICRLDSVTDVITGDISKIGDMFTVQIRVLDVKTKEMITSADSDGKGENSLVKQVDQLSEKIAKGIGLSQRKIEDIQKPVSDITTNSLDALNFFRRGMYELYKYNVVKAIQYFEMSINEDSTFASAYAYLSDAYRQSGHLYGRSGSGKSAYQAIKKAKTLSYKASEKEKLYIEFIYAGTVEKDQDKKLNLLKEMVKRYPKEKTYRYDLAELYGSSLWRLYSDSIIEAKEAIKLDPDYAVAYNSLGRGYLSIRNFEKALDNLHRSASLSPGDFSPYESLGLCYLEMGKLDEAIKNFSKVQEIQPGFVMFRLPYCYALLENYEETLFLWEKSIQRILSEKRKLLGFLEVVRNKIFYQYWIGSKRSAFNDLQKAEIVADSSGYPDYYQHLTAHIYYDLGDLKTAKKTVKNRLVDLDKLSIAKNDVVGYGAYSLAKDYCLAGLINVKEGEIDSAKSSLKKVELLMPSIKDLFYSKHIDYHRDILHGEILLAEKSYDHVITIGQQIILPRYFYEWSSWTFWYNFPFQSDISARAYKQKGDLDNAIAEYIKLITIDQKDDDRRLIYPKYHYRLAKLYEEKGEKHKAIQRYQKFLNIWKNADDDLPEKMDAKKRLNRLKG